MTWTCSITFSSKIVLSLHHTASLLAYTTGFNCRTNADKLPAVDATISSASAPSPAAMQLSAGSSASALQAAQPQSAVEQNMIGQAEAPGQIPVQAASDRQGTAAEPRFEHMEHQTALRQANRQQMMPKSKKKQASTMPFARKHCMLACALICLCQVWAIFKLRM